MSTKSIAAKLLIKPNTTLWLSHTAQRDRIEPLPEGVRVVDEIGQASTALVFADDASSVRAILNAHTDLLAKPNALWIAYPKANRTDINRDTLWPILAEYGLRPITQVAVDEVWSALRFRPLKDGETFLAGGHS